MAEENQAKTDEELLASVENSVEDNAAAEAVEGQQEQDPLVVIEALKQELADTREQALRTAAEAQNIRRRAEIDADNARKYAIERFAGDLLPVVDNLERALEAGADDASAKAVLEGVELTYRSFLDLLERHKLEVLNPQGEPFDPQMHQAMTMVEAPGAEPNSVIQVVQKGYTLNGRLLRAAMVVVSK